MKIFLIFFLLLATGTESARAMIISSKSGIITGGDNYDFSPYNLTPNTGPFDFGSLLGPYGTFTLNQPTYLISYTTTGTISNPNIHGYYDSIGEAYYVYPSYSIRDDDKYYYFDYDREYNDPILYSFTAHSISWLYTPDSFAIYSNLGSCGEDCTHAAQALYTPEGGYFDLAVLESTPQAYTYTISTFDTAAVPEPSSWLLMALGSFSAGIALRALRLPRRLAHNAPDVESPAR